MTDAPIRLLLDTDIGSDIDDAVCLAYLLSQRRCDLRGITTVSGDVVGRARIARVFCDAAGRDVPIRPGAERPLLVPCRQPEAPQVEHLPADAQSWWFPTSDAVRLLSETIRRHPHEVTLLAIGPLTNIAALFLADPDSAQLLEKLVVMGGNVGPIRWGAPGGGLVEWNIWNDPHAAAIVFRTPVPRLTLVPLDVTTQVELTAAEARARFRGGLLDLVARFVETWFAQRSEVTFHDPLAGAICFDESLCGYTCGEVMIETSGTLEGFTQFKARPDGPHHVATSVDAQRFFDEYFATTAGR